MNVEYRVLGPLEVLRDGVQVPVTAGRGRVLLATLLLRPNEFVSVDELVDRLWDGEPPTVDRAHKTLQMVVRRLRMALGDANCVRTTTGGYLAEVDPDRLDLTLFRRLVAEGEFAAALAHWRGPVAADVDSPHLHREDVPQLVEELLVATGRRIDADLARGRSSELVAELQELTGQHPLREGFWAQLVQALHRAGRPEEALAAYERIRAHLADELGVEPGQPLRELHERLLDPAGVPRQLPAPPEHFAGRDRELTRLSALAIGGAAVVITAIDGTAGIGKTALAVRWAHTIAAKFPDGQLYADLRGFDPSADPVAPADVLAGFLDAFGVPGGRIPADLPERAALYRSVIADRRVLVLLDNARDVEQVRPLLPAGRGCLAVVTSRNRFTGLVVREGAVPVTLDLLTAEDATALLTARLGEERVQSEPDAVADLIAFCAGLPLALAVLASRAADDPTLTLRALADELAASDLPDSVETVFTSSYRTLDPATARLFRLIALATGPDISLDAASALDGRPRTEVRKSLQDLTRMHLLTERTPNRYSFHDLLRAFSLARSEDAERPAAVRRLLDFYLHTAEGADRLLRRSRVALTLPEISTGVTPTPLADRAAALKWSETEHRNLMAATRLASGHGLYQHAWQLPTTMFGYLNVRQVPSERVELCRIALDAARAANDPFAVGNTLHSLGNALSATGSYDEADDCYAEALAVRENIGHLHGIAVTLDQWAVNHGRRGDLKSARPLHERAVELRRVQGEPAGLTTALNNYAMTLVGLKEHETALAANEEAYATITTAGLDYLLASTLDTRGMLLAELGRISEAIATFHRALALPEDQVATSVRLVTLENLADTHLRRGRPADAVAVLREALRLREAQGNEPATVQLRARIAELGW
ncbi:tetratricopeptide repeat protein [Lentzea alba]|uniref:AfsR/SARP family transcriptional regulator n=1 Tax=Lentzea alba TaxID=2714351 RepID=UPI0039BF7480